MLPGSIKCKRILYKISGESLMGSSTQSYDVEFVKKIAEDVKQVAAQGIEVCLVVGGGNLYRGVYGEKMGMDRAVADYMGMLATVMNGIALQNIMKGHDLDTRVMSAISMAPVCEPYIRRRAMRHLEKGRAVIFVAGTGNPFFTTDTAAVLRAMEAECEYVFKGTGVDGVYTDDPRKNSEAKRFSKISYQTAIEKNLKIMDMSAISLARDKQIPIVVFSIKQEFPLTKVLAGELKYTLIANTDDSIE